MEITAAIDLIKAGSPEKKSPSVWADLGCGDGLFTKALASLLGNKSKIIAVDKAHQAIDSPRNGVSIEFIKADFVTESLPFVSLDGVLMANSLHYVKDKIKLIERIKSLLKGKGQIIIVEYEMDKPNAWVPYPITFTALTSLLAGNGFEGITKIGEHDSIFNARKCMDVQR